jgi:putative hydrolase of the HAD superfamily
VNAQRTDSRPLQIVFYDLGGVLVNVFAGKFMEALADEMGMTPAELAPRLETLRPDSRLFDSGEIDGPEFHRRLVSRLGSGLAWERFKELYTGIFSLKEDVAEVAASLQGHVRLSIISNTDPLHFEYLINCYPIFRIFEKPVTSFAARAIKPDPAIFHYALQAWGVQPEEALFIDDVADNVAAARGVGMQAIHFQGVDQLRQGLGAFFPHLTE